MGVAAKDQLAGENGHRPTVARERHVRIPLRGDRVERMVAGITIVGTVHYADELQVLVKWDNGQSSSLRIGRDTFWRAAKQF